MSRLSVSVRRRTEKINRGLLDACRTVRLSAEQFEMAQDGLQYVTMVGPRGETGSELIRMLDLRDTQRMAAHQQTDARRAR